MTVNIEKPSIRWLDAPVFAYGFRTFFLLAALAAVAIVLTWLGVLLGLAWPGTIPVNLWHGHEMVFGFVAAAIAGFLLTAVPSWTGMAAVAGPRLAALALLWTAGRIASLPIFATSVLAAAIDIAFLPVLGAVLAAPLVAAGKLRNSMFLVLLAGLALANLLVRLEWIGATADTAQHGITLATGLVLLMVTVIGGRIIPAFTQNALRQKRSDLTISPRPALDRATILLTISMVAIDLAAPESALATLVTVAAALAHALRLAGWKSGLTLAQPLLWVLHLGYAWIPVALALKATALLGLGWGSGWLHALTVGAFTTMILAVTSRAALGHTGRPLIAARMTVAAYILAFIAAILRVALGSLPSGLYVPILTASALAWVAAFMMFLWVYTPILWRPRPDRRPG